MDAVEIMLGFGAKSATFKTTFCLMLNLAKIVFGYEVLEFIRSISV